MNNLAVAPKPELSSLALKTAIAEARRALSLASNLDDLLKIHNGTRLIAEALKIRDEELDLQNDAAETRVEAECKIGSMLSDIERERGNPGAKYGTVLAENNLAPTTAHRWQVMARVPESTRRTYYFQCRNGGVDITSRGIENLAPTAASEEEPIRTAATSTSDGRRIVKVSLMPSTEFTVEEQEDIIWQAIDRAYRQGKGESLPAEVQEKGIIPGYWLTLLCAEYTAHSLISEK